MQVFISTNMLYPKEGGDRVKGGSGTGGEAEQEGNETGGRRNRRQRNRHRGVLLTTYNYSLIEVQYVGAGMHIHAVCGAIFCAYKG